MKIREVAPEVDIGALLAGAQFANAYRVALDGTTLDARRAAEKMFARGPRWIERLLRLRNTIVAPFGLKKSGAGEPVSSPAAGTQASSAANTPADPNANESAPQPTRSR